MHKHVLSAVKVNVAAYGDELYFMVEVFFC